MTSKNKKIIHLARLFAPSIGGVETHVAKLAQVLSQKSYEQIVITTTSDVSAKNYEQIVIPTTNDLSAKSCQPIAIIKTGGLSAKSYDNKSKYSIYRIKIPVQASKLQEKMIIFKWIVSNRHLFYKANIIHAHDVFWWILPILPMIRRKIFTTFHGWEGKYPVRFLAKMHRFLVALLSEKTIHVGGWIQDYYWDKPSKVIYGAVDHLEKDQIINYSDINKSDHKSKSSSLSIVFLGRLDSDNSIDQYIQLLKLLAKKDFKINMTWVGDGKLADRAKIFGKVVGMQKNPQKFLIKADLVFCSSYLSIFESLALGKIVCSIYNNPLKKSYLEHFPLRKYLIINDNIAKISEIIGNDVAKSKNEKDLLGLERSLKAREFTWQKIAKVYENIWGFIT